MIFASINQHFNCIYLIQQSQEQNTMSSHSKLNQNTKKKADIDTTLSAKLIGKSKGRNQQKPKISPFKLQDSSQSCTLVAGQSKQLKAIKDINHQYIDLFHNIFKDNKQLLKLFYMNSEVLTNPFAKLTKEQRYQLQCMKLFQNTCEQIQKMNKIKHTNQQWEQVVNYINSKMEKQQVISRQQLLKIGGSLVHKYQQTDDHLKKVEEQHEHLIQKNVENAQYIENKQDNYLTKIQKSYKKSQRKLNKITAQEQYYQQKCIYQQKLLQQLQQKIRKAEESKLNIEMKIISDKSRNDRIIRKQKDKREKSFAPSQQKQTYFKAIKSKSSTRINHSQFQPNHKKNAYQFTPTRNLNYF